MYSVQHTVTYLWLLKNVLKRRFKHLSEFAHVPIGNLSVCASSRVYDDIRICSLYRYLSTTPYYICCICMAFHWYEFALCHFKLLRRFFFVPHMTHVIAFISTNKWLNKLDLRLKLMPQWYALQYFFPLSVWQCFWKILPVSLEFSPLFEKIQKFNKFLNSSQQNGVLPCLACRRISSVVRASVL